MNKYFIFFILIAKLTFAQEDSISKKRLVFVSSTTATTWSGSIFGLYQVWYKNYPQSSFHLFDDSKSWMQMDKAGHIFTAYHMSDKVSKAFQWSGLNRNKSAWIGAGVGWGYQLSFELLDAHSAEWGFSISDVVANTLGSTLFLSQEILFEEQIARLKFSYSNSPYAQYRPNTLGSTFSERLLKDYNGQTYWLNISPKTIFKTSKFPAWLDVSMGYSVDQKLEGDSDFYQAQDGTLFFAKRQFLLSLDVRPDKLPIKKKWIKKALSPLQIIKFPFPTLIYSNQTFTSKWFYF
jgi:hypothetical protein